MGAMGRCAPDAHAVRVYKKPAPVHGAAPSAYMA
jgi:hypothetical protein